jgi:hypothetical protein
VNVKGTIMQKRIPGWAVVAAVAAMLAVGAGYEQSHETDVARFTDDMVCVATFSC